jgi:hydrogenase maturation protease
VSAVVAALGTPFRGDDAVGPLVAERLRAAGVEVLDCGDEPIRLVERLSGIDLAVVVDAVRSGARPGTVHRVESLDAPLPRDIGLASTHAVGVADAIELARLLGGGPRRVLVVGVEGRAFGLGDAVTPEVRAAVEPAAAAVLEALEGA